ncbi:MAG: YncE family protein [Candidatus Babeliales bacterium]
MNKNILFSALSLSLCVGTILDAKKQINANRLVATINVGVTPTGIAIAPNNKYAYVANNNNYGLVNGDSVSIINLKNNTILATLLHPSFNEPYTITINNAGTRAYVTNSNSTTITIIDIRTNTIAGVIDGFDGPSGMAISPDDSTGYVNNYGGPEGVQSGNGKTVSVVDLSTNTIIDTIVVDLAPAGLAITPDGAFVYVINYVDGNPGTGTISVIQTSSNTVVATIDGFSGPFDIAITPNGQFAYVTNFGSNNFAPVGTTVSVVNISNNTIVATIQVGIQPSGIAISPDGNHAYVAIYDTLYAGANFTALTAAQGVVVIIDIATNTVIAPILAVGQSPNKIAVTPNGAFAYISNYISNSVSVLNILERMWLK